MNLQHIWARSTPLAAANSNLVFAFRLFRRSALLAVICAGVSHLAVAARAATDVAPAPSADAPAPKIYQLDELDHRPSGKSQIKPHYPLEVKETDIKAVVEIVFIIDAKGHAVGARARDCAITTIDDSIDFDAGAHGIDTRSHQSAETAAAYPVLREAAVKFATAARTAVEKWTFFPGKKGGQPVNSVMSVQVVFLHGLRHSGKLNGDDSSRYSYDDNPLPQFWNSSVRSNPFYGDRYLVYIPKL